MREKEKKWERENFPVAKSTDRKPIVTMPLSKMGEKKKLWLSKSGEELKKKKMLRPQYFYNIFTTNHR